MLYEVKRIKAPKQLLMYYENPQLLGSLSFVTTLFLPRYATLHQVFQRSS